MADKTGANPFEGYKTQRVYAPLSKTRAMDDFIDHPRILALLDALLMPNYLLSQAQIINILPVCPAGKTTACGILRGMWTAVAGVAVIQFVVDAEADLTYAGRVPSRAARRCRPWRATRRSRGCRGGCRA